MEESSIEVSESDTKKEYEKTDEKENFSSEISEFDKKKECVKVDEMENFSSEISESDTKDEFEEESEKTEYETSDSGEFISRSAEFQRFRKKKSSDAKDEFEEESDESEYETSDSEESEIKRPERKDEEEFIYVDLVPAFPKCEKAETAESESTEKSEEESDIWEENEVLDKTRQIQRDTELNFKDTFRCKDFLNKFVKVLTADGTWHAGLFKYLDPVSGNMLIVDVDSADKDILRYTMIFPNSCVSVTLLEDNSNGAVRKVLPYLTVNRRKIRMINWFKCRGISVYENEDGSLLISDRITIHPPYEADNCVCDNPMVLQRVKDMLQDFCPTKKSYNEDSKIEEKLRKRKVVKKRF